MMDALKIVHAVAVIAAFVVITCRAGMMTPDTDPIVRWQHLLLLSGLLFGAALQYAEPGLLGPVVQACGVLAWLLLGSKAWRRQHERIAL
ncbi:hypothetical protein [Roseateles sp.]|jgi:hypothetical protein|uniref:hypothetical protein n=1 Tax=Roseateles sp. TaxID=1971397 RepID=UPI003BAACF37